MIKKRREQAAPDKTERPYENYVINDPEEMDEAPDTGDMFDDSELYGDYEAEDGESQTAEGTLRGRQTGINGVTLTVLWVVFVLLAAAYVYFFFIGTDITLFQDTTGRDNTVNIDIPSDADYSLCQIEEINQLIGNYLLALTKADQSTLKELVTDSSEFDDMKSVEFTAQYITSYNRTTCYIVPGVTDGSYVVYELSNISIKDVDSTPLDIRSFYVVKQEDGSYKINNSLTDDESTYVNNVTDTDDIQAIYEHVKENNDYIARTDESFQEFRQMYQ